MTKTSLLLRSSTLHPNSASLLLRSSTLHPNSAVKNVILMVSLMYVQEMEQIWGQGEYVQIIHPLAACISGRELVSIRLVILSDYDLTALIRGDF